MFVAEFHSAQVGSRPSSVMALEDIQTTDFDFGLRIGSHLEVGDDP